MIVPATIIPFVWHLKSIRRRHRLLSHENIGETKAVKPVYVSQKLLARLTKGVRTLPCSAFSVLTERNTLKLFDISLSGQ